MYTYIYIYIYICIAILKQLAIYIINVSNTSIVVVCNNKHLCPRAIR